MERGRGSARGPGRRTMQNEQRSSRAHRRHEGGDGRGGADVRRKEARGVDVEHGARPRRRRVVVRGGAARRRCRGRHEVDVGIAFRAPARLCWATHPATRRARGRAWFGGASFPTSLGLLPAFSRCVLNTTTSASSHSATVEAVAAQHADHAPESWTFIWHRTWLTSCVAGPVQRFRGRKPRPARIGASLGSTMASETLVDVFHDAINDPDNPVRDEERRLALGDLPRIRPHVDKVRTSLAGSSSAATAALIANNRVEWAVVAYAYRVACLCPCGPAPQGSSSSKAARPRPSSSPATPSARRSAG